jgi:hypothetical protein
MNDKGEVRLGNDWVGKGGRARTLRAAKVTGKQFPVSTVVCLQAKGMKDVWVLCASNSSATSGQLVKYYTKRWSIETCFRDTKDWRFGKGLGHVHIADPVRRDRLLLMSAIATVLLTLLGAASEAVGMDRLLRANTSKKRAHSLFRQGCMCYELIPNMPEQRLQPLMRAFGTMVRSQPACREIFAIV